MPGIWWASRLAVLIGALAGGILLPVAWSADGMPQSAFIGAALALLGAAVGGSALIVAGPKAP